MEEPSEKPERFREAREGLLLCLPVREVMVVRGVKTLAVLFVVFATGLTAWAQCGTIEEARTSIVAVAMMEIRGFEETYGVQFDWTAARVSARGEVMVVGIPVVEPYGGFYPGDIVAGFVIRGYPGRPDGGYALQLGDGPSVNLVNSWGETLRVIPVCDPRFGDCDPMPSINALPIAKFHSQVAAEENCCYVGYVICWGTPPYMECEDYASWTCPCPD